MVTATAEWAWEVRLECGFSWTGHGSTEQKEFVREHNEFICPDCDVPQRVVFYSARGA